MITKKYFLILILLFLVSNIFAQRKFKGTITYKISYGESTIEPTNLKLLPTKLVVSISGKYIKRESFSKLGTTTIITNLKEGKSQILINLTNKKKYIRDYTPNKKSKNREILEYKTVPAKGTKKILDYECKKINLVSKRDTLYGFYPEKLKFKKINTGTPYSDVNYILLEYTEKSNFPIIYQAVEIKREKLDKEIFEVPEGFKRLLNL